MLKSWDFIGFYRKKLFMVEFIEYTFLIHKKIVFLERFLFSASLLSFVFSAGVWDFFATFVKRHQAEEEKEERRARIIGGENHGKNCENTKIK